ncbi:MAG: hypothetical protein LUQ62_05365, partial [Methanomicrobiales archaeon]|nr:hypothetical protein [Methanomicrobiales archaeon]
MDKKTAVKSYQFSERAKSELILVSQLLMVLSELKGEQQAGGKRIVLALMDGVLAKLRGGDAPRRAPMPNLIPTSLSLWAGIYNVIFGFRAGAAVIIMERFDTRAFADFV